MTEANKITVKLEHAGDFEIELDLAALPMLVELHSLALSGDAKAACYYALDIESEFNIDEQVSEKEADMVEAEEGR